MSNSPSETKNVIVIGGGASGFFCAINMAIKNKSYHITILEKTGKLLSKVRVSGGGRCNVTHACYDNTLLTKHYPRGEKELRSVFSRFSTGDVTEWFENKGVKLKTEADGRIFPESNSSETILQCLTEAAKQEGVKIQTNTTVDSIHKNESGTFSLQLAKGNDIEADVLVIATGGNAKAANYEWLSSLGHMIKQPVPSLFTFKVPNNEITNLMGIAVPEASIKIAKTKLTSSGPLLITHWGFSGPAILKASAWGARKLNDLDYHFTLIINWIPACNELSLKAKFDANRAEAGNKTMLKYSGLEIPKRLWEFQLQKASISDGCKWADLPKKQSNALLNNLLNDEYAVKGKTTYKEEFVTCGGISLKDINLTTMESKKMPNLFFAGEVIDVDGITGGFNFQNAWSTSWIVAQHA